MRHAIALTLTLLIAAIVAAPASAQAQATTCPGTFSVLHNDRIGQLSLPQGPYTITVNTPATLTCAQASDLFRQFLQDFDGRLRGGWTVNAATSSFARGASQSFTVAPAPAGTPAGTSGSYPATAVTCPSTFDVLHDDRIGALRLPAGSYYVTVLDPSRLTCAQAVSRLQGFLIDFDGVLPWPWTLDPETATFLRGSTTVGFQLDPVASGGAMAPDEPDDVPGGTPCPSTFRVLHDDRIGSLRLPAGRYLLVPVNGTSLTCQQISNLFRRFLSIPSGRLPGAWRVNPTTGTFRQGAASNARGFRVKRVAAL